MSDSISTTNIGRITRQTAKKNASNTTPVIVKAGALTKPIGIIDENRLKQLSFQYQEELHRKRLESLKRLLYSTRKDNWRFHPIDSILSGENRKD